MRLNSVVRVFGVVVDDYLEPIAPESGTRCREPEGSPATGEGDTREPAVDAVLLVDADDDGIGPAVQKVLLDGEAECAQLPEPAELAVEIGEAEDAHRLVDQTAPGAADEGGDRCRHAHDGPDIRWQLLDIDARIGNGEGHRFAPPLLRLSASEPSRGAHGAGSPQALRPMRIWITTGAAVPFVKVSVLSSLGNIAAAPVPINVTGPSRVIGVVSASSCW
jgi:hypothetical protein